MKRKILASAILAALLSTTALADTSSMNADVANMGILQNEWVKAGVNGTTGTLGSGNSTTPGLLFDPAGLGAFNPSYDYLTPGSPFDGFAVKIDGTNYNNNNAGNTVRIANDGNGLTDGTNSLSWTGGVTDKFNITNTYSLAPATPYIDITSSITMLTDATTLSFGKFIDPDSQGMPGDSSSTDNVLGYGVIPSTNVAFSEATTSRYALGIYTTDTNVTAGIEGWTQEADGYSGTNYTDGDGNPVNYGNSDDTIGISWTWTGVSTGDILTANYAYIFGPSAFTAAESAITGGAGGGDTTTTDGWGTLEDVGSATDAASSASTPVITTETIVDTSRPVLTASITHHDASDDREVQTIDRETTTTTTTPMVTNTYTDGVLTSSVAAPSVIASAVTDPGSFVGRIDQVATAQDVVNSSLRIADFTTVNGYGLHSTYDNGMSGRTSGGIAGAKTVNENGVIFGLGGGQLSTSLDGNGDTVKADTTAVAVTLGKKVETGEATVRVAHGMTDYTTSRTIGDFSNSGETKGTDTSIRLQFEGNGADVGILKIKPVVGVTRGKTKVDAYTEEGSIQSARTVAETTEMYTYGTLGASVDVGIFNLTAMHNTDGVNDVSIGLSKETERVTWNVTAHKMMTDLGKTDSISLGMSIKF